MTSVVSEKERTGMSCTDPTDAGPWYKCPVCEACLNNRAQFLIHLSIHDHDDPDEKKAGRGGPTRKNPTIKINPENKPIFHTPDG